MDEWFPLYISLVPFLLGLVVGRWWAVPFAVAVAGVLGGIAVLSPYDGPTDGPSVVLWARVLVVLLTLVVVPVGAALFGLGLRHPARTFRWLSRTPEGKD